MKKFRFRLERVLEHRKRIAEEKKRVLAEKNRAVIDLESKREDLIGRLDEDALGSGIEDASLFLMNAQYKLRLRSELAEAEEKLEDAREEQKAALADYEIAARDEKALIKLKEKRESEHREYVLKEEEKYLDEMTVQRVGFNAQEES
ncbi:MAG: flagellar FliJ family protein [Bdellovibrionales bacterium]|nr:flagellar FliJ family protein [Bdellovibrionales bacterium]